MGRKVDVRIRYKNKIGPTIHKKRGDQLEWFSRDKKTYLINFPNGSPFAEKDFTVNPGKPGTASGPANEEATGPYTYNVTEKETGKVVDPTVFIDD